MARHSAPEPETGHRRRSSAPAQVVLIAFTAIAVGVLLGSVLAGATPVSGTFIGSQTAGQVPPAGAAPSTSAAPTATVSAPSMDDLTATPTTTPPAPARAPVAAHFASCDQAKAAGVSLIPYGDPRYAPELDHDGDGTACDRHGDPPTHYLPPPIPPPARCTCDDGG